MQSDCDRFCHITNAFCLALLLKIKPRVYYAVCSRLAAYGCARAGRRAPHRTAGRTALRSSTLQASLPRNGATMDHTLSGWAGIDFRGKIHMFGRQKDCRLIRYMAGEMLAVLQEWTQP